MTNSTQDEQREALLDALEGVRARQNKRHMGWVRMAFRAYPKEAAALEREILVGDGEITEICEALCKLAEGTCE